MTEAKTWGGARPGAGRKKGSTSVPPEDRKTQRIVVMASPKQEQAIKQKAEEAGMTVSAFLLSSALK